MVIWEIKFKISYPTS